MYPEVTKSNNIVHKIIGTRLLFLKFHYRVPGFFFLPVWLEWQHVSRFLHVQPYVREYPCPEHTVNSQSICFSVGKMNSPRLNRISASNLYVSLSPRSSYTGAGPQCESSPIKYTTNFRNSYLALAFYRHLMSGDRWIAEWDVSSCSIDTSSFWEITVHHLDTISSSTFLYQ